MIFDMSAADPKDISDRSLEVLKKMAALEHEAETSSEYIDSAIVCDGIECWIGYDRTSWRVVKQLLQSMLISDRSDGGTHRYEINESGKRFLAGEKPYRDSEGRWYDTPQALFAKKG
jgi:hypothetical protein